ncbi:uncharacterized protein [Argopecten irradians]|uniref:uncharacterized protein isoform X2 n=1 Tax=Argopecten irradians TaxID=31199 RepID=UPI003715EF66
MDISLVSTILEATSFAFLLVCLMFCPVICPEPQVQGMEWVCTPCILYLAAGICSIAGCIMMGFVNVQNFSYGWSYRLCFASGIYVVIQVVLPLIVFGDKSSSSCDRS